MGSVSVSEIVATPLKRIAVVGGDVLHALKKSDACFSGFGEAYFSLVNHGVVKAWKRHREMVLNLVVPVGCVGFVFIDDAGNVRTESVGENNYRRLTVPPGLWFGFKGLGGGGSLVMNLANIEHDPQEVERKAESELAFDWGGLT